MTKQIELTQGQFALVDDWRFEELSQWKWHAQWSPNTNSFYAVRNDGKSPFRQDIRMHNYIMKTPKGLMCDHINHNTLDNQVRNLRNVTHSQNGMNRRVHKNNKLGEKNISIEHGKYHVHVQLNNKKVFHKRYSTLEEAIVARDAALRKYHGKYALGANYEEN